MDARPRTGLRIVHFRPQGRLCLLGAGFLVACGPKGTLTIKPSPHPLSAELTLRQGTGPIVCIAPDVADEVHEIDINRGTVLLRGLLPRTVYECTAQTGEQASFETDPLPDNFPTWTVTGQTEHAWTLTAIGTLEGANQPLGDPFWLALDNKGRVRWFVQEFDPRFALFAGHTIQALDADRLLVSGGGMSPAMADIDGNLIWQAPNAINGGTSIGHAIALPTGEIASAFENTNIRSDGTTYPGVRIEAFHPRTAERTYSWTSELAVNRGQFPATDIEVTGLAYFEDDLGQSLMLSTNSRAPLMRFRWPTGDWVGSMGPFAGWSLPNATADEVWFQHQQTPAFDLLGNHMVVYENPVNTTPNRVLVYSWDWSTRTLEQRWSFSQTDWIEPAFGSAQFSGAQTVLVTRGHCVSCPMAGPGTSEIVSFNWTEDTVDFRLTMDREDVLIHRALPLEACDWIRTNPSCVTAAGSASP